jgi:hypothetical protein
VDVPRRREDGYLRRSGARDASRPSWVAIGSYSLEAARTALVLLGVVLTIPVAVAPTVVLAVFLVDGIRSRSNRPGHHQVLTNFREFHTSTTLGE